MKKTLATILVGAALALPVYAITSSNADENKENKFSGCLLPGELEKKVEEIQWYNSFKKAQKVAKEEQKPMMVDFMSVWCPPCRMLDKTTFKDPKVVELSKNYINVKVDGDAIQNKKFMNRYEITRYPTIVFLHEDGSKLKKMGGYQKPETFTELMEYALAKYEGKEIYEWDVLNYDLESAKKQKFYSVETLFETRTALNKKDLYLLVKLSKCPISKGVRYFVDRNKDGKTDLVYQEILTPAKFSSTKQDLKVVTLFVDDPYKGKYSGYVDRILCDSEGKNGEPGADGKFDEERDAEIIFKLEDLKLKKKK